MSRGKQSAGSERPSLKSLVAFFVLWALSSAGSERTPHTRKVTGSIPVAPTIELSIADFRLSNANG